ncbi:TetR/AcrR family transcriptional regulator [Qipengyuania qiaonensis]|uniref:TetR/AcrR family transcriptional regulator n=1 Tax=Qipengyuania qiaonensis TaxID=2867240 RepID=A0ABS7J2L1_9SPHN|nr:TetR/AcrR family transcriptional regulator [Qipengyuania qiaonensis]MBX7481502.1 TetR/AcrR family transcriptional regulator [Qipengyuania qiaonensis]
MASRAEQAELTRQRILICARALFAEKGFYGVSTAQVAKALGLSKQGVLHYFMTKEKLYGAVLGQIAEELTTLRSEVGASDDPAEQFTDYLVAMIADTPTKVDRTRLLMREILDNRARAQAAGIWYLKPFLEELIAMLRAVPGWSQAGHESILATVIQLLGAVNYHSVSAPTFHGIFGTEIMTKVDSAFANELRTTVGAMLQTGPAD